MSKKHKEPVAKKMPPDTIAEKVHKVDGVVVHERIHPSSAPHNDAPGDWGKLTKDLSLLMKTAGEHQPFFQAVKVIDRDGCCKVFGTLAWKEKGEIYTMPLLSGGTGKGALPGMICGTDNIDPLAINNNKVIPPYHIGSAHTSEKLERKVVSLSVPRGTQRDDFACHVICLDDQSHGCPVAPMAFAQSFERCMDVIGGHDLRIAPSTSEGRLSYNVKQAKMQEQAKIKALVDEHKKAEEHKKESGTIAQVDTSTIAVPRRMPVVPSHGR